MDAILIISIIIALTAGAWFLEYHRRQKIKAVAEEMGLEFLPKADLLHQLDGCDLTIHSGHSKNCVNCLGGEADGIDFKVFDYRFKIGYGKNQRTYAQTIALMNFSEAPLPNFFVKPQSFMGKMFGGKPACTISVDSQFDSIFWVSTAVPNETRKLLNQEVKDLFRRNNWCVESNHGRLLIYREGKTVSHATLKKFLTDSLEMMMVLQAANEMNSAKEFPFPVGTEPNATDMPSNPAPQVADPLNQQAPFGVAATEQPLTKRMMGTPGKLN